MHTRPSESKVKSLEGLGTRLGGLCMTLGGGGKGAVQNGRQSHT